MAATERTTPLLWNLTGEDALVQGSEWIRYGYIDYVDDEGAVAVFDTTGYTAVMTVREDYDAPVYLSLTTENGRLETGLEGCTVKIHLPAAATGGLTALQRGVYDLFVISPFGVPQMLYYGNVTMIRKVSP